MLKKFKDGMAFALTLITIGYCAGVGFYGAKHFDRKRDEYDGYQRGFRDGYRAHNTINEIEKEEKNA